MKTTKVLAVIGIATLAFFAISAASHAHRFGGGHGMDYGHESGPGTFSRLNVTDEQKSELREIFEEYRDTHQALMQNVHNARQTVREAIVTDGRDSVATTEAIANLTDARDAMMDSRLGMLDELRDKLTPEQLETFKDSGMGSHGFGMTGHGGMGHGHWGGDGHNSDCLGNKS